MYTENRRRDVVIFLKAALTNQLAKYDFYLKLGNRSGRGEKVEAPEDTAAYFRRCVDDYCAELGADKSTFFAGKRILEYGPGDTLGVALVLYALGAEYIECVDRFPLHTLSPASIAVYSAILRSLEGDVRERAGRAFKDPGNPASGFDPRKVEYRVTADGLSARRRSYDVIISRSVLALVNRLDKTIEDIAYCLKDDGVSIHKVDLTSHGLDRDKPLDFLSWPDSLYQLMYSRKGRPNRFRVDKYKELAAESGLVFRKLTPTGQVTAEDVERVRPTLPSQFRSVDPELLRWLGFWMVLEHRAPR